MIKAVLFDVDGVLLDSFDATFKFYQSLFSHFGYPIPTHEDIARTFHLPMKGVIKELTKSNSDEEIEKIWIAGKDRVLPYPLELLKAHDNTEEVIDALHKEYTLGVVTSRTKENIFRVPQMARLQKYFSVVVGYQDVENHKPYPDSLLLALEKLGLSKDEAVYIGDMPTDMEAARASGVKFILYAKDQLPNVDATTYSFLELPSIIKNL